jgi:superfamily II DNA or RNA helicase
MSEKEIEYGKGYPIMYGLSGGFAIERGTQLQKTIKNGSTWYASNRKSGALTYFPKKPKFEYAIVLKKESLATKADLYNLDAKFIDYVRERGYAEYYIQEEGGKEWYYSDCPISFLELRLDFLQKKNLPVLEVFREDCFPVRNLTKEEKDELEKEDSFIQNVKMEIKANEDTRLKRLIQFQQPHIQLLQTMFTTQTPEAGLVIAPCGYGKTIVSCQSLKNIVNRLTICVPNTALKSMWKDALLNHSHFKPEDIYDFDKNKVQSILQKPKFALLLCYQSSHILDYYANNNIQLGIFDEAHHLAGIVQLSEQDNQTEEIKMDVGRTKRLVRKYAELHIPRLSLTFTPKGFILDEDCEDTVNSNDDKDLFGEPIVKVPLREMISHKLLPPYEVRFPQVKKVFDGVKAKVQLMLHEFQREENGNRLMKHLIVFAADHRECKDILQYMNELLPLDSKIQRIYLEDSSDVEPGINKFEKAEEAILINCALVGEGTDIPIADSVCILCNKESYIQLVQNLLRPGRYFEGKEKFYMIMALADEDDVEFIAYTLDALTKMDPLLDKEMLLSLLGSKEKGEKEVAETLESKSLDDIIVSEGAAWWDIPAIRKCIEKIIQKRTKAPLTRRGFDAIRKCCLEAGIFHQSDYEKKCEQFGWPADIWIVRDMLPYDFFHPKRESDISIQVFRALLIEKNLLTTNIYTAWQMENPSYPSIQDINEGYFGRLYTNFQSLLPNGQRRR